MPSLTCTYILRVCQHQRPTAPRSASQQGAGCARCRHRRDKGGASGACMRLHCESRPSERLAEHSRKCWQSMRTSGARQSCHSERLVDSRCIHALSLKTVVALETVVASMWSLWRQSRPCERLADPQASGSTHQHVVGRMDAHKMNVLETKPITRSACAGPRQTPRRPRASGFEGADRWGPQLHPQRALVFRREPPVLPGEDHAR